MKVLRSKVLEVRIARDDSVLLLVLLDTTEGVRIQILRGEKPIFSSWSVPLTLAIWGALAVAEEARLEL